MNDFTITRDSAGFRVGAPIIGEGLHADPVIEQLLADSRRSNGKYLLTPARAKALVSAYLRVQQPDYTQLYIPDIDLLRPEQLRLSVEHVLRKQRLGQPHGAVEPDGFVITGDDAPLNPEHPKGPCAELGVGGFQAGQEGVGAGTVEHPQRGHLFTLPPLRVAVKVVEVSPVRPADAAPMAVAQISVVLQVELDFEGE